MNWRRKAWFVLLLLAGFLARTHEQSVAGTPAAISCPPDTAILPCRCRFRDSAELQIWCSHSDLTRVLAPLKALSESRGTGPATILDELILEGNRLGALPGRAFHELRVTRLMLRENGLQRLSASALAGQEASLTEIFIVEPELTHIAQDIFRTLTKLQAITIESSALRRIPRIEGLPGLRYLKIETSERSAWRGLALTNLPELEQLHLSCASRGAGLDRLDSGFLQGIPRLEVLSVTQCALVWLHPHSLAPTDSSLVTLDLSDNLLDDLGQVTLALRDLAHLAELRLNNNQFRSLSEGSLVSLPALRTISLAGNQLNEVTRGAFHLLPSLERLDLSRNMLKRLHPDAFTPRAAPRLQELDLSHNTLGHLAEVRPWVAVLPTLRVLDVSDNGLEELGWAALGPAGHPLLELLSANHNNIRVVRRDALSALPALRELHLRNNSLDEHSLLDNGSPWNLPGLKGLDLGENTLRSLDARLFAGLPSLRRLDVSQNRLSTLQGSPFSPSPLLEYVNLSRNALQVLPGASLGPLRALYELDISHNNLNALPANPGRSLQGLGVLNVAGNHLASIPRDWTSGQSTQTLQLSGNALRSLPSLDLIGLTRLDVSRNLLLRLDADTMTSTRELMFLNVSNNEIAEFPDVIRGFKSLRDLDLSGNRISALPDPTVLSSLHALRSLRLARNQLTTLSQGTVQGLPRLASLGLAENRITRVEPGALVDLPLLTELDLAKNAIGILPTAAFSQLPSLRAASFKGNRLREFDASVFERAPRLLLLDLSYNELRRARWGRPTWSTNWGLQSRRLTDPGARSKTGLKPSVLTVIHGASARALEAGPGESDVIMDYPSMPGLEVLDLSYNNLRNLEDAGIASLPWLVELKADNNEICGIRANSLSALSRLRVLSLRNNRVSMLQERAFRNLRGNMVHLNVAGNPLSCSCGLLWLQAWMEEEPNLQPSTDNDASQQMPRCADGSLLRDVGLSRAHCQQELQRGNRDEQREENEIMAQCSSGITPPGKFGLHQNIYVGAPNPEESEYFYEEFVEYPQGAEIIANHSQPPPPTYQSPITPAPIPPSTQLPYKPPTSNTPTLYAGPSSAKLPPNSTSVIANAVPNNDSPFTIFGYPLPSITSLLRPSSGRSSGKRIEAMQENTGTAYEDGFIPSLGPPNLRPQWVFGPAPYNTSESQMRYQTVTEPTKQTQSSIRQGQTFSSRIPQTTTKSPMKFPPSGADIPAVTRKGISMPIDHRGSLPIRDDLLNNVKTVKKIPIGDKPVVIVVTTQKSSNPSNTASPFRLEATVLSNDTVVTESSSVIQHKKVIPLTFSEEFEPSATNAPSFNQERTTTREYIAPTIETSTSVATTHISFRYDLTTEKTETTSLNPSNVSPVPQSSFTSLQLLVPGGYQPPVPKATITKVEQTPLPPPKSSSTTTESFPTNHADDRNTTHSKQATWWYYRDYNRTNLEPFRGEYLSEEYYPVSQGWRQLVTGTIMCACVITTFFMA